MVPAGRVGAGGVGVGEGAGAGGADAAAEGLVVVAAAAEQAGAVFVPWFGRYFGDARVAAGGRPVAREVVVGWVWSYRVRCWGLVGGRQLMESFSGGRSRFAVAVLGEGGSRRSGNVQCK
jgi:hypothetical protein